MISEVLNKKVLRNYEIIKKTDCGIKLLGEEVKSLRYQGATFVNSYIKNVENEIFLVNLNIPRYKKSGGEDYNPIRPRKLLINKNEIIDIKSNLSIKGRTVIPLRIFLKNNLFKVEIAVVKGLGRIGKKQKLKDEQLEKDTKKELEKWEEY